MNSRYCLTFKSTFQPEKPKKLENYFFYVKIFDCNYLHLTAQTKETYFIGNPLAVIGKLPTIGKLTIEAKGFSGRG